jgi:hypothetical protein
VANFGEPLLETIFKAIPKVKAYAGHLPDGVVAFEFETAVEPDKGGVPGKPTWSHRKRPGVVLAGDYARIRVKVLKTRLP